MRFHRILAISCTALALTFAHGCGSNRGDVAMNGDVSVVLTDAANDELESFEVDLVDLVFTKYDLSTVSVLPRATRIDFAALTSFSEMVAGVNLPAGMYTRLTMDLDFTNAVVSIQGQSSPATVLDTSGAPITGVVPVQVVFPAGARPVIGVNRHHLFSLDLNLDQGVTVDSGGNSVTFCPVLSAQFDPSNPKPSSVTGVLTDVDTAADTVTIERRAVDDTALDSFTVAILLETVFQVDGVNYVGAAGTTALAGKIGGRVHAQGVLETDQPVLDAVAIEAGAGVPGSGQDWVIGHITGRDLGAGSDAALQVLGRSLVSGSSTHRYNTAHTVNVSFANTKVLRRGLGGDLDTDDLQVGQLVWAFGTLSGTTLDATAGTGVVRLLRTHIFGVAAAAPAGNTLTMNVTRFDLRDVSAFDFTVNSVVEADPTAYTVDVTGLDTTGVTTGSKVSVLGFVHPVGVGSDTDAAAVSLVDHAAQANVLFCQWSPASLGAIADVSTTAITLDVGSALLHEVLDGFAPVTVTAAPAPTVVPRSTLGVFCIVQDGAVEVNLGFLPFSQSLAARLQSNPVFRVAAYGVFDATTQEFSASVITVVLQ